MTIEALVLDDFPDAGAAPSSNEKRHRLNTELQPAAATTYEVVSLIKLDIPLKSFKDAERKPSPGNYWDRFDAVAETQDLTPGRIHSVLNAQSYSSINEIISTGLNFTAAEIPVSSGVRMQAANMQVSTKSAGETDTDSMSAHAGGNAGINLGIVSLGGGPAAKRPASTLARRR